MFKRLAVYYRKCFLCHLLLWLPSCFEIYFVLLLNDLGDHLSLTIRSWSVFTIFVFLMILRIADDFKDYETDRRLFPHRALPSGRSEGRCALNFIVAVSSQFLIFSL